MKKIKLYIAISLNGKIAATDGSVDWLESIPNPEQSDYGYTEFYDSIDTTLQGYKTFEQVLNFGIDFPYKGKDNYVLTTQKRPSSPLVTFISENPIERIKALKQGQGKDIWVIGGGQINTLLWNAGLIDELYIFVMPIVLDGGINLFESLPKQQQLKLISSKNYASGVVEMRYAV